MVWCQFEEAILGKQQNRAMFPIILVVAGLLLLVGAVVSVLLLNSPGDQLTVEDPSQEGSYPQVSRVDLAQAKSAYDSGTAVFVDVRDQVYYDNGHIPGAISIPLGEIEDRLDEIDPNDWIILYCTWPNEETSARAASILTENGYQRANPVLGGLQSWSEAGYPIEP